jgi:hypothetical protein
LETGFDLLEITSRNMKVEIGSLLESGAVFVGKKR